MKRLITISLLLLSVFNSFAGGKYVSAAGNDANPGTQAQPYLTINKINSIHSSMPSGDTVFFRSGDTFHGTLRIGRSGVAGHPMVFTSYGAGAKPILTGLVVISGWVKISTNIWEAPTTGVKVSNNLVLRNGVIKQVGRYPNANAANGGYLTYTASTATSITGPALSSVTDWTNAEVAVRLFRWEIRRRKITGHSAGTVSFLTMTDVPGVNRGYFFQRDARTLDQDGEWFQNGTTNKLRMYFSNDNPSVYTVQASTVDTIISSTRSYITIDNLSFVGSNRAAIMTAGGSNFTIKNCDANNNGGEAFSVWYSSSTLIDNCTANNSLGGGIKIYGDGTNSVISNCTVNNTSQIAGMEITDIPSTGNGINFRGSSGVQITKNVIKNSGYTAINWRGNNVSIKNNLIDSFCSVRDDGGGIYTYQAPSGGVVNGTNRKITNNIILHGIGAPYGTSDVSVSGVNGVYTDENIGTVTIDSNTIAYINGNGFHGNNNANITLIANNIYSCLVSHSFQRFSDGDLMRGMAIKKNVMYPYRFRYRNLALNLPSALTKQADILAMGVIDSNYYSTKTGVDTSLWAVTQYSTGANFAQTYNNFGYITGTVTQETHSTNSANTGILVYNAADTTAIYPFDGYRKLTPQGINYYNYISIPKWESRILINNGNVNVIPTAFAGNDTSVTLPSTSLTVTGYGNDTDGSITAYNWIQIAGPSTLTIVSPNSATTVVNGLNTVGRYTLRFRVTDNYTPVPDTAVSYLQIDVNPPVNLPPTARAGNDTTIVLPTSSVTLSGVLSSDPENNITSFLWTKISGPTGGTLGTPNSVNTTASSLQEGTYVFSLKVTDGGGLTSTDFKQVVVEPAIPPVNNPPSADAGPDQNVTIPLDSVTVDAGGSTDSDGTIVGYLWRQLSGTTANIVSPTSAITKITGLSEGTNMFQVRVTDNSGDTSVNEVVINVFDIPVNQPPVAIAGPDQDITSPSDSALLDASASFDDLSISSYKWRQLSGPTIAIIVDSTSATTEIRSLVKGDYIFQVEVKDYCDSFSVDAVQITVQDPPGNIPPSSNAGTDKTIFYPNSVTLTGSGSDTDGEVVLYQWSGDGVIVSPNSTMTEITGLSVGEHIFTFTVIDDEGGTSSDTVKVTVLENNIHHYILGIELKP